MEEGGRKGRRQLGGLPSRRRLLSWWRGETVAKSERERRTNRDIQEREIARRRSWHRRFAPPFCRQRRHAVVVGDHHTAVVALSKLCSAAPFYCCCRSCSVLVLGKGTVVAIGAAAPFLYVLRVTGSAVIG
ncbi:hypothetical protein PIB30_073906 [Stylosanthes scabra]|uniref:Uncharacterized protein n=1 Tax=Stylosanthes scabra TaxID=79078 RepID=A0ABU6TSH4_9FABA|nr:hypothetical protein [Stylosanthes scabra]